jgi:hypothetical protein
METPTQEIPTSELSELRRQLKRPLSDLPNVRHPLPEVVNSLTILPRPLLALVGLVAVMLGLVYAAANAPGAVNFAWGQIAVLCWTPLLIGGALTLISAWRYFLFNLHLRRLARRPTRTRGLVFQLWKDGPDREIPCVLFSFLAQDSRGKAEQVNISETVTPEQFRSLVVNQPVEVAYLPDDPTICRILYN